MKINLNKFKTNPLVNDVQLCFYGKPSEEISEWINFHKIKTEQSENNFTNLVSKLHKDMFIKKSSI